MNKAAYKLKGLPPIYCINLDGEPERWDAAESMFKEWDIENYTRVSAYDGREDDLSDILVGKYPENMSGGEIGCTTSHLRAMKHYLETSDSPYAVMMEDDCSLDLVQFWNFTWKDFYTSFPYDYDVVQIAIICTGDIHTRLHKRFVNDFSTASYVITRHHAEKLVRLHCRDDKYKLDQGSKPRAVADDLIYNSGNTYAMPLLLYKIEMGSSIHGDHVEVFHRSSHNGLSNFWKNDSNKIENWDEIFDYDPYMGRLPPEDKK